MFKANIKLNNVEKKYCACLVKVRSKKNRSPYGICTNSVYGSRGIKRNKVVKCSKSYNLSKLKKYQLRNLAIEKNIKKTSRLLKKELIELLETKII
jgi:hypothetical protein